MSSTTNWNDLPREMKLEVLKYLTTKERQKVAHCSAEMSLLAFDTEREWKCLSLVKHDAGYFILFGVGEAAADQILRIDVRQRDGGESCALVWEWCAACRYPMQWPYGGSLTFVNWILSRMTSSIQCVKMRMMDLNFDDDLMDRFENVKKVVSDGSAVWLVEKILNKTENLEELIYISKVEQPEENDQIVAMITELRLKRVAFVSELNNEQFVELVKHCDLVMCDGKNITCQAITAATEWIFQHAQVRLFVVENLQFNQIEMVSSEIELSEPSERYNRPIPELLQDQEFLETANGSPIFAIMRHTSNPRSLRFESGKFC